MILRQPLITCLSPLVILMAGVSTGRANPDSLPESPTEHHSAPPVEVAAPHEALHAENPLEHPESQTVHPPAAGTEAPAVNHEPHPSAPATEHSVPESHAVDASSPESAKKKTAEGEASTIPEAAQTSEQARREIIGLQNLGVSLTERSDWDAAEIAFRQILKSPRANGGDLANALLGLARVYRRQGSLTKAAAIYERYLKDYPSAVAVPDALLELGRTQRALGAHQLALARFYSVINSTLKLSSENSEHYQVLAKTAQFEIAETHFQDGDYAEANKFFSRLRLLDLAPADRARAHFKSADALFREKEFAAAVKTLTSYLEQWPQDENVPEARYLLSLSLRALDRKQEALDATLTLLRTAQTSGDPKRWTYWQRRTGNQLANDFFQSGDTHHALMIYQGLSALTPEPEWRLPVTYQIGLCYERMRLYDRAMTAYQSIIDTVTPSTPAGEVQPKSAESTAAPSTELSELVHMAKWRLGQIDWHEKTEHQLAAVFSSNGEPTTKPTAGTHTSAPNIDTNVSSQPTPTPVNEHSGNSPKTSARL